MSIRSFIALAISQETANELGDVAAKMSYQDKSGALRWVDQENYHVTLAFLGEQRQADLELLAENIDACLLQHEFTADINHIGPFPDTKPKLIAAMLKKSGNLSTVRQQVISAVHTTGMNVDKRKFQPHITLARYRHSKNSFAGGIPTNIGMSTFFDEVVLFESELTVSGAVYEPIYRFPLDEIEFDRDQYSR